MAGYTVDERERHGKTESALHVQRHARGRAQPQPGPRLEHVAVYRRDDGQRVVEFRTQDLLGGDLPGDNYAIVAPEDLRRVIVEGCAGPQADAVARQLGFEISVGWRH